MKKQITSRMRKTTETKQVGNRKITTVTTTTTEQEIEFVTEPESPSGEEAAPESPKEEDPQPEPVVGQIEQAAPASDKKVIVLGVVGFGAIGHMSIRRELSDFVKVSQRAEFLDAVLDPAVMNIDVVADLNMENRSFNCTAGKTVISSNASLIRNLRWRITNGGITLYNIMFTESSDDIITLQGRNAKNIYIKKCGFDSQYGFHEIYRHSKTPTITDEEKKNWNTLDKSSFQQNVVDGQVDIIDGANHITLDGCIFQNHDKVQLIRNGDTPEEQGTGFITLIGNLYKNTFQRAPQNTGIVHIVNNLYLDVKYGLRAIEEGNFLAENNAFINVDKVNRLSDPATHPNAYGRLRNNIYRNISDSRSMSPVAPPKELLWEASDYYAFDYVPLEKVEQTVLETAGPRPLF